MKKYILFFVREFVSKIILLLGGVYIFKVLYAKKNILVVLNYHNFSKYNNYKIKRGNILETGYAANFEKQIQFLKRHFSFCYPEEFFKGNCEKGINMLITFDDGYKDNYDIALPILKKHQAKAIFFIATNYIGSTDWLWHDKVRFLAYNNLIDPNNAEQTLKRMNRGVSITYDFQSYIENKWTALKHKKRLMMSWNEVFQIVNSGFRIGSHTSTHKILTSIEKSEIKYEIESSLYSIKNNLNYQCTYFAFPNGLYNDDAFAILNKKNIDYCFTTIPGVNYSKQSPKELKRIGVNASDTSSLLVLKLLLSGMYGY